ncbi:hypothetical protein Tcan_00775, partial [Toxocara canis]
QEIVDSSVAAMIDEKRARQSSLTTFSIYWLPENDNSEQPSSVCTSAIECVLFASNGCLSRSRNALFRLSSNSGHCQWTSIGPRIAITCVHMSTLQPVPHDATRSCAKKECVHFKRHLIDDDLTF